MTNKTPVRPRRIDAHVHFWKLARGDYEWMTPDLTILYRDYWPADLQPYLDATGMQEIVIVQAAATVAETEFILDIARKTDFVSGVVGWVNLEDDAAPQTLGRLAQNPYFKGIRPMIQDIADVDWMLRESLTPGLRAVVELDLAFDCLVKPPHLQNLHRLLARHPDLRAVIDHGAKPQIAAGAYHQWAADMNRLAEDTTALCKFSGLITEAGGGWTIDQLKPYADHLLRCFGPDRLIFGSDWPVVTLAGSYETWFETANQLLGELSATDKAKVFGENAARFYKV
ncbi:MAG: amidohydrolase family protein [Sphingomonadales bacterium]|nr:amidohydrolase family protein [Sphingomonadales bacterium]